MRRLHVTLEGGTLDGLSFDVSGESGEIPTVFGFLRERDMECDLYAQHGGFSLKWEDLPEEHSSMLVQFSLSMSVARNVG